PSARRRRGLGRRPREIQGRDHARRLHAHVRSAPTAPLVVLNRSDLLSAEDAMRVSEDMRTQLGRKGLADIGVAITRARDGAAGIGEFRDWLDSGVEAKRIVASRIAAEAHEAVRDLAARTGVAD